MLKNLGCGRNETREQFEKTGQEHNPDQTKMMTLV